MKDILHEGNIVTYANLSAFESRIAYLAQGYDLMRSLAFAQFRCHILKQIIHRLEGRPEDLSTHIFALPQTHFISVAQGQAASFYRFIDEGCAESHAHSPRPSAECAADRVPKRPRIAPQADT
jgi:hypothetical protein